MRARQRVQTVSPYPETAYRNQPTDLAISGFARQGERSDTEAVGPLMHTPSPPVTGTASSFDGYTRSRSQSPSAGKILTNRPSNATFRLVPVSTPSATDLSEDAAASSRALYASSQLGQHGGSPPPMMLIESQNRQTQSYATHPYSMGAEHEDSHGERMAHTNETDYQTHKIAREVASLLEPHLRSPSAEEYQPALPKTFREQERRSPPRQLPDPAAYARRKAAPSAPPQYQR